MTRAYTHPIALLGSRFLIFSRILLGQQVDLLAKLRVICGLLLIFLLLSQLGHCQNPSWQWAVQSTGTGIGQLKGLAVDAAGNSYQVGFFTESISFGATTLVSQGRSDVFVAKLTRAGNWEWAVSVGAAGSDHATGVAIDAAGRIFISGSFNNQVQFGPAALKSQGDMDVFVAQISPYGQWQWANSAGGPGQDRVCSLAVSSTGALVVGGQFTETANFGTTPLVSNGSTDAFVARINHDGNWQWAIGAGAAGNDEATAVATNAAGDIYVTGYFSNTVAFGSSTLTGQGMDDAFVGKISGAGQWRWATAATSTSTSYGKGLAVDPTGGVFVTGSFWGSGQFGSTRLSSNSSDDGFVSRITDAGQWQWTTVLSSNYLESIVGIALDKMGKLYVAGTFSQTIYAGTFHVTSRGYQDVFIGYLNQQGAWLGLTAGGGAEPDGTQAMALAPGGEVFVGGDFSSAATFGATQLQSGTPAAQVCVGRATVPQP